MLIISYNFHLNIIMPIIIMAIPINSFMENGILSVPNKPKASIIPADVSCATKIMAMPQVAPIAPILFITVNIMMTPSTPPSK